MSCNQCYFPRWLIELFVTFFFCVTGCLFNIGLMMFSKYRLTGVYHKYKHDLIDTFPFFFKLYYDHFQWRNRNYSRIYPRRRPHMRRISKCKTTKCGFYVSEWVCRDQAPVSHVVQQIACNYADIFNKFRIEHCVKFLYFCTLLHQLYITIAVS